MPRGTCVEPGMNPSLRRSRTSRMSTTWTSPRAISASSCATDRFSIRVFASSTIWPMVFLGFHVVMGYSSRLDRRTGPRFGQADGRGEASEIAARAVGQSVGRALEPPEPAVDIALQDARRVGDQTGLAQRLQAGAAAALDEHRAAQRLLTVGGHDRNARGAAAIRVTYAPGVLAEKPREARHPSPRPVGHGIHDDLDADSAAAGIDGHEAEPEPPAEVAHVAALDGRTPAPAAALPADREVDAIGERQPIDALQDQRESEAQLQLHDHRRLVAADGHDVTAAHLGLDVVSLVL